MGEQHRDGDKEEGHCDLFCVQEMCEVGGRQKDNRGNDKGHYCRAGTGEAKGGKYDDPTGQPGNPLAALRYPEEVSRQGKMEGQKDTRIADMTYGRDDWLRLFHNDF